MKNRFVIQWKNTINGRAGRGTKVFSREEAEEIANDLNAEYPDIHHEVIPVPPAAAVGDQPQSTRQEPEVHNEFEEEHEKEHVPA